MPIGTRAHAIVAVAVAIVTLGSIHLEGVFRTGSDVPAAVLRKVTVMGSWSAHTLWWLELNRQSKQTNKKTGDKLRAVLHRSKNDNFNYKYNDK